QRIGQMSRDEGRAALSAALFATAFAIAPVAAQDSGVAQYGSLLVKPDGFVPGKGRIVIPASSWPKGGGRARTHTNILVPDNPVEPPSPGLANDRARATISIAET